MKHRARRHHHHPPMIVADFSHWDAFDAAALVSQGIIAVVLKATQGATFIDNTFVARVAEAQQAGLLVGAYHFADDSDALSQVDFFLRVAGSLPVLALDLEPNGIGDTVTIPTAAMMASFLQTATKRAPLIYTGKFGPSGTGAGYPNSVLSRCPLWLAEYDSSVANLPAGWSTWTLWQETDSPDDLDYFNGSDEQLRAWWGS